MKKLSVVFLLTALVCSCDKDQIDLPVQEEDNVEVEGGSQIGELPEVIYASMSDEDQTPKTRTFVDGNRKDVLWQNGDDISYFAGNVHNAKYVYNGETPSSKVELEKVNETGTEKEHIEFSRGIYPYNSAASVVVEDGVEKIYVTYPATQTYAPNSFGRGANLMIATGSDDNDANLYFRNACGYLVIKLYNAIGTTKVKNIELTALGGEKLSGMGYITASSNAAPSVAMDDSAKSTVSLNCGDAGVVLGGDKEHATEFWFALPPVTFEKGFKILVTPTEGQSFEMQTSKKVEVTRNDIRPMAALQFTQNVQTSDQPAPNQLFYTTDDDSKIAFYDNMEQPFNANITNHYYDESIKKFVIECDAPITEIKDNAFRRIWNGYGNVGLISVSLPSQLKTIGSYAFYANPITELVIPGNVTLIKNYAFKANSYLQRVTFLWGEEKLQIQEEDGALTEAYSGPFIDADLEYIYVDRDIEYKDENGDENDNISVSLGLFKNSRDPKSTTVVNIGPNMSTIPASMFASVSIVNLVIPGNITSIGKNNFYNRHSIEEIIFLPSADDEQLTMDGTYNIGDTGPFYLQSSNGDKLKTVRLNREINYILEGIDGSDEGIFSGRRVLETLELGPQVKTISNYMFAGTQTLTNVTIPNSVTYIGNNAFEGCTALTSVSVSESGATMGNNVFKDCDALKTATLGAQTIGTGVLYDCDALETVTIKGTVNTIGNDAFYSCGALKNVNFEPSAEGRDLTLGYQTYGTEEQGPFYDGVLETVNWYRNISYTMANAGSADQDDEGLFSKMSKLTSVNIGEQVKSIPPYTFASSALPSITIPANVSTIDADAFRDCDALHTVIIESSANPIKIHTQTGDWGTFYDSPLSSIKLDREVNYVNAAGSAFTLDDWDEGVFANEEYNGDFTATVTLGSNVKTIWPWMFSCVRMQNIEIPASVTSIGKEAFSYCYILDTVTCKGTTAPTLGEKVFYDSDNLQNIYVPSGSLGSYQSKWNAYKGLLHEK